MGYGPDRKSLVTMGRHLRGHESHTQLAIVAQPQAEALEALVSQQCPDGRSASFYHLGDRGKQ